MFHSRVFLLYPVCLIATERFSGKRHKKGCHSAAAAEWVSEGQGSVKASSAKEAGYQAFAGAERTSAGGDALPRRPPGNDSAGHQLCGSKKCAPGRIDQRNPDEHDHDRAGAGNSCASEASRQSKKCLHECHGEYRSRSLACREEANSFGLIPNLVNLAGSQEVTSSILVSSTNRIDNLCTNT